MEQCDFNFTSDELMQDHQYSTVSWSVILIFLPLVAAIGVTSNLAFIFVVYRVKSMRTTTNIFLVNLAISDSSLLIVAFGQSIGGYAKSPMYNLGFSSDTVLGCVSGGFLIYLCYYTSLWTVTLVSIERYLAVCHPLWYMYMRSTQRSVYLTLSSWIIAALFASPTAVGIVVNICIFTSEGGEIIEQKSICYDDCYYCIIVLYATDVIQFVIALIVNIVLYSLIIRKVGKSFFAEANDSQKIATKRTRLSETIIY